MSLRAKVYLFLLAIVAAAGGYYLYSHPELVGVAASADTKEGKKPDAGEKPPIPVEIVRSTRGNISTHVLASGNLRAATEVEVAAQLEGIAAGVLVEEGDYVGEGQVLAKLDDGQFRIGLELAEAKLQQARLQLEKAGIRLEKNTVQVDNRRVEYERYKVAHQQGLVPETEVAQRKYQLDEMIQDGRLAESEIKEFRHKVEELESEIAQARLNLSRTEIKAPFAGFVTRRTVERGQRVRNLDTLFSLGRFQPLYLDVFVSERESRAVRPGQPVTLSLGTEQGEETTGTVDRISPVVDQSSGTVKVTVRIQGAPAGFRPGAFTRAAIRTDTHQGVLLIPKKALLEQDGSLYAFVAVNDAAERVLVETGYENDGKVEVRKGLSEGQAVVVAGQGALKDGARLQVTRQ